MTNIYDLNNRLTKQTKTNSSGAEEGYQYYYDNNGNQTFKQRFGYSTGTMMSASLSSYSHDIESFTYNAKNQLTGYTKGSTTASYTYGANGLRKSKTVGSTVTGFIWNGQNLAAETNGSTVKNIYSYGPDGIQCGNINGSDILYVKDAHGNTVTTLNGSKGSIRDYTYDAFGNQLSTITSSDTNPFRYCGEYYDKESGLMYLRNRYYDSSMGRFITEDPVKDGLNWYSYCGGNPIMLVDPVGLYYLEKDEDGQVYAVIEDGDTLSSISYAEVGNASAYLQLNYADPGYLEIGQRVNITDIYNDLYPIPTNIVLSKTSHTQGDSGLRDLSDEEVSRRARDKSLSGQERRKYQREEKLRGNRNKQKRQSHYSQSEVYGIIIPDFYQIYNAPSVEMSEDTFWDNVNQNIITIVGIVSSVVYFCYTSDPSMIYQYAN
ncbi:MAG: RHS repeat-associated core domain-containing protein [bacterium]|nr:RHS repeat-associated core domain-containing protein [bacterium]